MGFATQTYKFQEYTCHLRFVYHGKDAWAGRCSNEPPFIHLKPGETVEQVLRQHEKPSYSYFQTVELPKLLTKPTGIPTVGSSEVRAAACDERSDRLRKGGQAPYILYQLEA